MTEPMPGIPTPTPECPPSGATEVRLHGPRELAGRWDRWEAFAGRVGRSALSAHPAWLGVLARGLRHVPYCIEALSGGETTGLLPLCYVRSLLFGRFLVGLPYLNYGGVMAVDGATARLLVDRGVELADRLGVRHLELRHARAVDHPALTLRSGLKEHMKLALPETPGPLWDQLSAKVRNQVRKGQKGGLAVAWGGEELLPEFYEVFSRNMRDLGTPVFGRDLFLNAVRVFPDRAEFCVVRDGSRPAAAALLLHGRGVTEVPSASSLRRYNASCANMLLYWNLLERAVHRGQDSFDFGRSTPDSTTYRFKKQWGARPEPAEWQFYVRSGDPSSVRPDSPRYRIMIKAWQRLPVGLTRWIGPAVVRGIP
jgi:FemAB-related protein (PEP-CTERM system-associated)